MAFYIALALTVMCAQNVKSGIPVQPVTPDKFIDNGPGARAAFEFLTRSLDLTVDPCDSFYDHVCGNAAVSAFDQSMDRAMSYLKEGLTNHKLHVSQTVTMVKQAYAACIKWSSTAHDDESVKNINDLTWLKTYAQQVGRWPPTVDGWQPKAKNLSQLLGQLSHMQRIPGLLSLKVKYEMDYIATNHTRQCLALEPSFLMMDDFDNDIVAFGKYITYIDRIMANITNTDLDDETSQKTANKFWVIENSLHSALTDAVRQSVSTNIDSLSVKFQRPNFDWYEYLNVTVTEEYTVGYTKQELNSAPICANLGAIEAVFLVMDKFTYQELAMYLFYRMIYAALNNGDMKQIRATNATDAKAIEQYCITVLQDDLALDYALGRVFVDQSHFGYEQNMRIQEIINYLTKEQAKTFAYLDWVDDTSKIALLQKLSNIIQRVGAPEWITNNARLDFYYDACWPLDSTTYWPAIVTQLLICDLKSSYEDLLIPGHFSTLRRRSKPSDVSQAAYNEQTNTFVVSPAFVGDPIFRPDYPPAVNFGIIGIIIGHETTHGYGPTYLSMPYADASDTRHRSIQLTPWTEGNFKKNVNCLIKQYNGICLNGTNHPLCVDGRATMEENLADTGGMRVAFNAFKTFQMEHSDITRIYGLTQMSPEQIFFLSWASLWCSPQPKNTQMTKFLASISRGDAHSPNFVRTDVPLMNMKEFAEAFGCQAGDRMNPVERCEMW